MIQTGTTATASANIYNTKKQQWKKRLTFSDMVSREKKQPKKLAVFSLFLHCDQCVCVIELLGLFG